MEKINHIHFLGIGGISQSAIALILKNKGYYITGSDKVKSKETIRLEKAGIPVKIDGISEKIKDADIVVVSAAICKEDRELCLARMLGKTIISRAEALGKLAQTYKKVISISGSHGKTTTTGMVAKIFCDADKNPTVHIGGNLSFIDQNVRIGGDDYFITEACEYVDSFLCLKSDISVILNIQKDHLDYFKNFANINKSFTKFAKNTKENGLVVYNFDDKRTNKKYFEKSISYSANGKGVLSAQNIYEYMPGKFAFDCFFLSHCLGTVKLGVFGKHNISNALASICCGLECGINFQNISKSLYEFNGVKRRFESYGDLFQTNLIHDYAHHPTEIKATISLAKEITNGDVFVVFQPHTYSRTKLLLKDFKTCFKGAKEVLVYKTYSARETEDMGIDEKTLAMELEKSGEKAKSFDSYLEMLKYIFPHLKPFDTLLVLGAGDIEGFLPYVLKKYKGFENIGKK